MSRIDILLTKARQADKIQKPSGKLAYQIGFEILEGYMAQTYSEKTSGFRASCMAFTIGWLTKSQSQAVGLLTRLDLRFWKDIWRRHIARKPLVFELPAWLSLSAG